MYLSPPGAPPLLAFTDNERNPLSIRAGALVFMDPRSCHLQVELERLSSSHAPLLIEGEQGTGKELLARYIHRRSERSGLFVAVNCGSISPSHGEAELFGHIAGVQGGALSSRAGWLGSAQDGTLYLEEIGDLAPALQIQLLAVLEQGQVQRVGASQLNAVDIRLVASTSFDLQRAVQAGRFHAALWERLHTGRLALPPLRERPADILPLAQYFLEQYCSRLALPPLSLHPDTQQLLKHHPWPGNTRELENCLHFSLLMCDGPEVLPHHVYLPSAEHSSKASPSTGKTL